MRRFVGDPASEVAQTCELALARLEYNIQKGRARGGARAVERLEAAAAAAASAAAAAKAAKAAAAAGAADGGAEAAAAALVAPVEVCAIGGGEATGGDAVGEGAGGDGGSGTPCRPGAAGGEGAGRRPPTQLLDGAAPLFERYRALFALRDAVRDDGPAAVLALCDALKATFGTHTDALLKHEVAFVLGQLEHPSSVPALLASMRDEGEHPMVRHEAAEALGALGDPSVMGELREMLSHPVDILRESCVVALHMYDREAFLAAGVCV